MTRIAVGVCSFCLLVFSCGKEELSTGAPSLIGVWIHYSAEDAWEKVTIEEDGTGNVEWYTNNKLHKDTKVKRWYVEDNELYLGKVTFSLKPYRIDEYPVTAGSTYIENFDTITTGQRYCVLNNFFFVEKG
ncbi:MAG: hypothetical protein HUJ25_08805 [Crocinitomicaceae bacterium]|nr:hypothetical protein [Crocinitomicaceae bacterium]